jgi:UDP-N-acetylglucosamine 1-carboxyvinyltransferase
LKRLGADVRVEHGYIDATCEKLTGAEFAFEVVSVTGTENLMMAACLARGPPSCAAPRRSPRSRTSRRCS